MAFLSPPDLPSSSSLKLINLNLHASVGLLNPRRNTTTGKGEGYKMRILFMLMGSVTLLFPARLILASCHFKHYGPRNITALQACIPSLKGSRVDNSHCGGVNCRSTWQSAADCYNLCASCLYTGVSAGASEVSCREQRLFAHCHVGYY
ncbi:uncharacterized protein VP01_1377g8 [Puccinia sorghi]|uniref:Uncharacterized protein n=1 Tax=Puccinia sorghi TaxID=27349 RepID=A0A0L6VLI1_9BASI|nr:uncharacterized protein VP01_1377g8 [Puccinia sorghi]